MSRPLAGSIQLDIDLSDVLAALNEDQWNRLLEAQGVPQLGKQAMQEASDRWRRRDVVGALYALEMVLPIEFRGWVDDIEKHFRGRK